MTRFSVIAFASLLLIMSLAIVPFASAATLSDASLELSDPRPSQTADYTFSASNFTTATTLRCIDVRLNSQADGSGSAPAGINTASFTLDSSSVITVANWSEDSSTSGLLSIENSAGEAPATSGELVFSGIQNGNTTDTYYAIVTTYSDAGCTTQIDSVTVAFAYTDGTLVELSIEPTLTFNCLPVGASESVNGATTSVASTCSGIDFGNSVTATQNGVAAHELEVSTNATGGYVIYIRHTGPLSNGSDSIANHVGTNADPVAFPGFGTEAWGYTTDDLGRFTSNLWAGFTTLNELVSENTSATVGTDNFFVGHQVGIDAETPAGTYQTTVVYTVVSTY